MDMHVPPISETVLPAAPDAAELSRIDAYSRARRGAIRRCVTNP